MTSRTFVTIKDEDGVIRPMAGLWTFDDNGIKSAKEFAKKDGGTVVRVEITEVQEVE